MQRQSEMGRVERRRKRERRERRSAHQPGPSGSASGGNGLKYKIQISKIQKERGGKMAEQPGPSERDFSQNTKCLLKKHRICAILKKGPTTKNIRNPKQQRGETGAWTSWDL